jgi:hypothetical protein
MMSDMNKNGIFNAELKNQNLQKGRGEGGTEFELLVAYRPRSGFASDSLAELNSGKSEDAK